MIQASPTSAEIEETFQILDNWEDRYGYVIDLGRKLPDFPEDWKNDANVVRGCTSQVWLVTEKTAGRLRFWATSDALIVKGLIAILVAVYNERSFEEVRRFDIESFFTHLGLTEHLSPNRRNGFFAIVSRLRHEAQ